MRARAGTSMALGAERTPRPTATFREATIEFEIGILTMPKGRKPKPASLRLVDGTHRPHRHGAATAEQARTDRARSAFGSLRKPPSLKGEGAKAWRQYIEPAYWLDGSREASAIAFCELWNEFRVNPTGFHAAKHTQMRAYMGELGLTDERNRPLTTAHSEDEFFDD